MGSGRATVPELEALRICLRMSAWLWLTGCRTSESARIRGLYTLWRDRTVSEPPALALGPVGACLNRQVLLVLISSAHTLKGPPHRALGS